MTRREFFVRASCAAAALAAPLDATATSAAGGAKSPERARRGAQAMFVSLNGAVTRGVSGADKIRLAANVGYGGVDWDLAPAQAAGLEATRALFADLHIIPSIVNLPMARPLPFAGDDAAFKDALARLAEDAAFVAAVGCRKMMVVLPASTTMDPAAQRRLAVDRLTAVAEVLRKSEIRLGVEFLGPLYFRMPRPGGPPSEPFIWNMHDALALAKDTGANVGVILDAWHWHHSGSTAADIAEAGASRIVHVHVSDAKAMPAADVRDNMRLMPGEGVIDLVGFFQALKTAGYTDGVSPEPLGRVPDTMSPEEGSKLALETTLAVMRRAGVR
ncbi:MAG TPA: sugar phosphate isomerase/epimerase family protein [Vicinamibacterales bacterium]|jgi:sugar phosphate isomerase/epimerase